MSKHTLGDGPISAQYREKMNAVAAALDETFNGAARGSDRKVGFVLLQFPFGDTDGARCNFISLRWGESSVNPEIPEHARETNLVWLRRELEDLRGAIDRIEGWIGREYD